MLRKLILAIVVVFSTLLLVACASRSTSGSSSVVGISCQSEETKVSNYTGIGINFTQNVGARLKEADGSVVFPSDSENRVTDNGIEFSTLLYNDSVITPGKYTVEILDGYSVIKTYTLSVERNLTSMLSVLCR